MKLDRPHRLAINTIKKFKDRKTFLIAKTMRTEP